MFSLVRVNVHTRRLLACALAASASLLPASAASAQQPDAPAVQRQTIAVTAAASAIVIDGVLDEPAWGSATAIPLTYEWQPGDNTPAAAETVSYMTFDAEFLYVAFRASDPDPGAIRAHFADRDVPFLDDTVGFMIDTFNDRRRAYQFRINPRGVQMDAINSDVDGNEDWSWDAIWDAEGRVTGEGYVVEVAVPWSSLRFPRAEGTQTFGFIALRDWPRSMRRRMRSNYTDRNQNCLVCQFDRITGFEGITPGRNVEFDPTLTMARTDTAEGAGPVPGPLVNGDTDVEAGLSAKWGITPNVTFSGTINPDFYQVEADAAQLGINTQFQLYFEEKRPFFLEGADYFRTPIEAVFTRTIVDPVWGAKVTGKEGPHAFGLFVARDEVTTMTFSGYEGSGFASLSDPMTSVVGRYRRDVAGTSTIGALVTSRVSDVYENHVAGLDGLVRIGRSNRVSFQILASQTEYPAGIADEAGQPAGAFSGHAYTVNFNRGTLNWEWFANTRGFSRDFRADGGFVPQTDFRSTRAGVSRVFNGTADSWYSRIEIGVSGNIDTDYDGERAQSGADLTFYYGGPLQTEVYYTAAPNDEYYAGVSYENFRHAFGASIRPTGDFAAGVDGVIGGAIDFAGAREAEQVRVSPFVEANALDRLALRLSHSYQELEVEAGRVFTANLTQARAVLHLNRRTFVRAILQHTHVDREAATNPAETRLTQSRLFSQYLFSYKLNPQTVLLAGYSDNQVGFDRGVVAPFQLDLTRTNRTFFLKIGYAWVL